MFTVFEDAVTLLAVSADNRYLVAADIASNIMVWINHGKKIWEKHCKLPKYKSAPTGISVQPRSAILVVVYANQKVCIVCKECFIIPLLYVVRLWLWLNLRFFSSLFKFFII